MKNSQNFRALFTTNFLGVFNNNFFRNLIAFVSLTVLKVENKELVVTLASGLYVMPYIFFSPIGGRLAKVKKKSDVLFWSKVAEVPLFVIACLGMYFQSLYLVLFTVFAVGLTSTLFSPSKYGLIRDVGGDERVSYGTGTLEMLTFLGVLLGTFTASILADHYSDILFVLVVVIVALIQLWSSHRLKTIPEGQPIQATNETLNPLKFIVKSYEWGRTIPNMNIIIMGLSIFWMTGNFMLMNLMVHCEKVLEMTNTETGIMMTIAAVGIGLGSFITGLLSKKRIILFYTLVGGVGMLFCFLTLFLMEPMGILFSVLVFFSSFFSGMYMVPLSAWVQTCVKGRLQGDALAYSNFSIFFFNLLSAIIFAPFVAWFNTHTIWLLAFAIVLLMLTLLIFKVKEVRQYK